MKKISTFIVAVMGAAFQNAIIPIVLQLLLLIPILISTIFVEVEITLLLLIIVLTIPSMIFSLYFLSKALSQLRVQQFVIDENESVFFIDNYQRARQIPDQATYDYLITVLGTTTVPEVVKSTRIIPVLGNPIPPVETWNLIRPKTVDEQVSMELQSNFHVDFDISDASHIGIKITYLGAPVTLKRLYFYLRDLPEFYLNRDKHKLVSRGYYLLESFLDKVIVQNEVIETQIHLLNIQDINQIHKLHSRLVYLHADVEYKGKNFELMI